MKHWLLNWLVHFNVMLMLILLQFFKQHSITASLANCWFINAILLSKNIPSFPTRSVWCCSSLVKTANPPVLSLYNTEEDMYNKTEHFYKTTAEKSLSMESIRSTQVLRGQKVMHWTPCRSPVGSGSAVRWRVKDQKLNLEPDQN